MSKKRQLADCAQITDRMELLGTPEFIDPLVALLLNEPPDPRGTPAFVLPIMCWAFTGHKRFDRPLTPRQRASMKRFAEGCERAIDIQLGKDRPLLCALRVRAKAMSDEESHKRLRGHARELENWPARKRGHKP